jgi:hypothetical protein
MEMTVSIAIQALQANKKNEKQELLPTIDIFVAIVDIQQAVRGQRRLIGVSVRIRPRVFSPAAGHRD